VSDLSKPCPKVAASMADRALLSIVEQLDNSKTVELPTNPSHARRPRLVAGVATSPFSELNDWWNGEIM
jgi:hypothetical protein